MNSDIDLDRILRSIVNESLFKNRRDLNRIVRSINMNWQHCLFLLTGHPKLGKLNFLHFYTKLLHKINNNYVKCQNITIHGLWPIHIIKIHILHCDCHSSTVLGECPDN